jgi:FkbM family methyltransferase
VTKSQFPISATLFETSRFVQAFCQNDFFFCADGDGFYPEHHCKVTWKLAELFCSGREAGVAVDVGCRDGEFTRYLMQKFHHVYCFDPRPMQRFADNVDLSKVTHFACALGDQNGSILMSGGQHRLHPGHIYQTRCFKLDEFMISNVSFIKIDVEGFEKKVLKGAKDLIESSSPVIVIEQNDVVLEGQMPFAAKEYLEHIGYRVVATCPRGWDYIMVRSNSVGADAFSHFVAQR